MSDPAIPTPPKPAPPEPAQPWAAPAVPPFGPPSGYAAPTAPPPGAYAPPPGYTGAYAPAPATRSTVGLVALIAGIAAAVGPAIVVSIATFQIGLGAGRAITTQPLDLDFDWSLLTPVRDWVLVAELSFWVGTALGVWAIVQGLVAIVTHRGRALGIAAIVVAVAGVVLFAVALLGFLTVGFAAGG